MDPIPDSHGGDLENKLQARARFFDLYLADLQDRRVRSRSEYQARFPGHEELIGQLHDEALRDGSTDPEPEFALVRPDTGNHHHRSALDSRDELLGPYRILRELGRGGQGMVYLAVDTRLGRKVALKVLTHLGPGSEDTVRRLQREAEVAAKLDHPGICGVHDAGVVSGTPYIAMQYVEGETLAQRLAASRDRGLEQAPSSVKLSSESQGADPLGSRAGRGEAPDPHASSTSVTKREIVAILRVFEQVARALHAAHEAGVVHRDIKPGNIMLNLEGAPVILDFGLASAEDPGQQVLTRTGDLFGTPAYMSPEQITGSGVRTDRRSDIYSLGVTLYECLTLKRPFEAPTREALYQAILSEGPERPRKLNRAIPSDLQVVLQCTMCKDRDQRYQTAADLAEDLRRVRSTEPVLAKKTTALGRAWRWAKRRPAAASLLCALALGIPTISGLGVWYWNHRADVRAQEQAARDEAVEAALEIGFYEMYYGDKKLAAKAFEEALSLNAASAEAAVGLVLTHLGLNERENALDVLARSEPLVADPGVLARTKAIVLDALDRKAEAMAVREGAPEIQGHLMMFLEGSRELNQGYHADEGSPQRKAACARAEAFFTHAVQSSPRARRTYHLQLALATSQCDPDQVNAIADAIGTLWPESATAWEMIGQVTQSDPGRAVRAYRELIRIKPHDFVARLRLGLALINQGRIEEGIAAYREAIRIDPDDFRGHDSLAFALLTQERPDEAIPAYRELIRIKPDFAGAYINLGHALEGQGQLGEAIVAYRAAIRIEPDFAFAHRKLGLALHSQGNIDEAIAAYREAVRINPDDCEAHYNLGTTLKSRGKIDEAVLAYRESIRIEPGYAQAHCNLGNVLIEQGKLDEAIVVLRVAIRTKPDLPEAQCNLGIALEEQGSLAEAVPFLRKGHDLGIRRGAAWSYPSGQWLESAVCAWARQLYAFGKTGRAIAILEEFLEAYPEMQQHLSEVLEGARRRPRSPEELADALAEALAHDPDDVEALGALAGLLVDPDGDDTLRDPPEALILARRAVALTRREDVNALSTLAMAFFVNGDLECAIAAQDEVLALMGGEDSGGITAADAKDAIERYRQALRSEKPE